MTKLKTILAAAGMTAAAALAPATASAQSYDYLDCKRSDKDAQVVGGLVGGLIGAVAGHEIAGRGETTEGAVIGGLIGAAAGAGIGDDRRNCTREILGATRAELRRETGYTVPSTTVYGGQVHQANHRHYRGYDRGYDRGYGGYRTVRDVRYDIERLKAEDKRLKRRAKYDYRPWIDRRRDEIRWEVKRLKRIEDRLEDRRDARRDYRRDRRRDYRDDYYDYRRDRRDYYSRAPRRGHYHGSNICYSDH